MLKTRCNLNLVYSCYMQELICLEQKEICYKKCSSTTKLMQKLVRFLTFDPRILRNCIYLFIYEKHFLSSCDKKNKK